MSPASFSHPDLPPEQSKALHAAIRLEWITVGVVAGIVVIVGLTAGSSQAMRTAFAEDMLSFLPPLAFLVAVRRARKPPDDKHPYGFHRSVGAGHLVASCALLGMGLWLSIDATLGLLKGDRPPIGVMSIAGFTFWAGWAMIAAMVISSIPPMILGRMKMKLAGPLNDKVLAADADMNKADWSTGLATIAGVTGIGLGLWWADSAAALLVSVSILKDGGTNVRGAVKDLLDSRATTVDGKAPHPLIGDMAAVVHRENWVETTAVRVRDMGHVFHAEVFVVPKDGHDPTMEQVGSLTDQCRNLDWKVRDTVVVPVRYLPDGLTAVGNPVISPR
ncbi:MAG: cation transporter [Propionibacteriaceae bacterium]|nr:cation transporter [Propionibacteriaceae bacterium]